MAMENFVNSPEENQKSLERFGRALRAGMRTAFKDPEEAIKVCNENAELDEAPHIEDPWVDIEPVAQIVITDNNRTLSIIDANVSALAPGTYMLYVGPPVQVTEAYGVYEASGKPVFVSMDKDQCEILAKTLDDTGSGPASIRPLTQKT